MNQKTRRIMQGRYHAIFKELCSHFEIPHTSAQRHEVNEWILGYDKSSRDWTGKEYSLVIDQIKDWIRGDVRPHQLDKNTRNRREHDEGRKQIIHAIEELGAPEEYIQAITNDRFAQRPWRDLTNFQLQRLRMTINRAMQRKRSANKSSEAPAKNRRPRNAAHKQSATPTQAPSQHARRQQAPVSTTLAHH